MKLKQIGHYKIVGKLGEGGMGVVYKAEDTKLKRTVALKFLPLDRLGTKEEKNRFVREAQAAAALNHPNIATIYAIDEENGQMYISMEYIDGETLKERVSEAPLKLKKAVDYAAQIALGLQSAHEQNVVHRDIKSANAMVTSKGQIKVMDFGLAKLSGSTLITKTGTTLGTIAYMSPEQAQGEEVDHRTDIWALGVVLYELITGQMPFKGDYDQALVYSILNEDPEPLSALRSRVPMALERIVEKCLAKDPGARYQSATEIPVDLKAVDISSTGSTSRITTASRAMSTMNTMAPTEVKKPSRFKQVLKWSFAALVLLAAGFSVWRFWVSPLEIPVRRLVINTEANLNFGQNASVAVSPDGKNLVYVSQKNGKPLLFLRSLEKFESTPIQGTENANSPFFSPDGQWIGFYADGKVKKASIFGGVPTKLLDLGDFLGATWTEEDTIYFSTRSSSSWFLAKVSANGGEMQPVTASQNPLESVKVCWPQVLPGGDAILFTSIAEVSSNPDDGQIEVLSLQTGERRKVLEGGIYARYSPTGHLVAAWSGGLIGVPFDLGKLEVTGPTVPILEDILLDSGYIPNYAFSEDGMLVFVQGATGGVERKVMAANLQGNSQLLLAKGEKLSQPQFSPDEGQLAFTIEQNGINNIWLSNLNDELRQLTSEGNNSHPIWTPDGKSITFVSDRDGTQNIFRQSADGTGQPEQLTTGDNPKWPASWSSNGTVLTYHEEHPDSSLDIFLFNMNERKSVPLIQTRFNERQAVFSPDRRRIAYVSDQSGQDEIYVRALSGKSESVKVSSAGGKLPMWHPNGQQLYYRFGDKIMAVAITTRPRFRAGTARELFSVNARGGQMNLSPKSARFLFVEAEMAQEISHLNVVLNWFGELNAKVPSGKKFFGLDFDF